MTRAALLFSILLVWATAPVVGDDKKPEAGKHAGFDQFKQLAGEWAGKEVKGPNEGKEVRANYKVTSGGSAVVETLLPGTDHEMVTVIHRDGDDLILTHYCMLGNQPQMKAAGKDDGSKVAFKFVRATNLKSDKDPHMHDVTFTFVDKDTYRSEWTFFKDGKSSGTVVFEMKRKK
jgi:hypothetical protein